MRSPGEDKQIEEAIKFLVFAIHETGHNPKPVILHSIRVGLHLYTLGYDKIVVIAGILHDVIEDSKTTISEIKAIFNENVAKLVEANSFDEKIDDKIENYKENFERCRKAGKDALIVKAADILDNADYCCFGENEESNDWWIEKMRYFIEISTDILKEEALYKKLKAKHDKIAKT